MDQDELYINEENPMDTGQRKNWYSPKELAADLNLNYMTIINALNSGQIAGEKIGKSWRIYYTTYIALIRRATTTPSREELQD